MQSITLKTKPIPVNALYRSINGRNILSKLGRETKVALEWEIRSQWRIEPHTGSVVVNLMLYFGDRRKRDIDSYLKVLLDSMNGIVYNDDSQIVELHVYKKIDTIDPRVEVQISNSML